MTTTDHIRYDVLAREAMRGVLRQVLGRLPGALVAGGVLGVVTWFAIGTLAVAATAGLTGFFVTLLGIGMAGLAAMRRRKTA